MNQKSNKERRMTPPQPARVKDIFGMLNFDKPIARIMKEVDKELDIPF